MRGKDFARITCLFVLYKLLQLIILYFVPCQFDTSSQLLLTGHDNQAKQDFIESIPLGAGHIVTDILDKFVVWDNVYFSDLFVNEIQYEHLFVFCPLWWRVIAHVPLGVPHSFYSKLLVGVSIANLSHYLSSLVLYYLTVSVFRQSKFFNYENLQSLALKASCLYVLSPGGVFLTASYSEAPCALLSFLALFLRELSLNRDNFNLINSKVSISRPILYILSGAVVAIAYHIRANALLLGILYAYDLFIFSMENGSVNDSIVSIISGSQLFFSIIASIWYPYSIFCSGDADREWCHYYVPSLFSYAQTYYWNMGFLNYWTPNNIPNFIFAMPTILLTLYASRYFISRYPFRNILPVIFINIALLFGGIFLWHTQILTRISTFLPLIYWYVASLGLEEEGSEGKAGEQKVYDWAVGYFVVWGLFQTGLFGAFLPPA